jgi:hypothetical protein
LAVDVVGYSRLMHADEEATLAAFSSRRAIVDDVVSQHHGRVCGAAGDSFLVEFASVVGGFRCAVAIQRAIVRVNAPLPEETRLQFRIGVNVGDVMVKDDDIFGDGVNIAARLEALAPPGGICVTRGVRDHLRDRLDAQFVDMGEHTVKNIARPVRVFQVVFDPFAEEDFAMVAREEAATLPATLADAPSEPDTIEIAFWESVQGGDDPAEYQVYLDHFPDGRFTALAKARLERAVEVKPTLEEDHAIELAFWNSIVGSDDPAMFQAYLDQYPNGAFHALAEAQLRRLAAPEPPREEDHAMELAFWNTIAESDNPAMFEAYLKQYPTGGFAGLAEIRIAELKAAPQP